MANFRGLPVGLSVYAISALAASRYVFAAGRRGLRGRRVRCVANTPLRATIHTDVSFPTVCAAYPCSGCGFVSNNSGSGLPMGVLHSVNINGILTVNFSVVACGPSTNLNNLVGIV